MICTEPVEFEISNLRKVALAHPRPDENREDCIAFSKQVNFVEGGIRSLYRVTAGAGRLEQDLSVIKKSWEEFNGTVERAMSELSALKEQFPYCGTPELHDWLLDLRGRVLEKISRLENEISWQDRIPQGLFQ